MDEANIKKKVILSLFFAIVGAVLTIVLYIFTSKWKCCCNGEKSLWDFIYDKVSEKLNDYQEITAEDDANKDKRNRKYTKITEPESQVVRKRPPLCSSNALVMLVNIVHIVSKGSIIICNIIYLSINKVEDQPSLPSTSKPLTLSDYYAGRTRQTSSLTPEQIRAWTTSYFLTFIGTIYEIVAIVGVPISLAVTACISNRIQYKHLGGYIRCSDLQFALLVSSFASVHLHYIGGYFWFFILVRAFFVGCTFVAVVIAGIRCVIGNTCWVCADIPYCNQESEIEITNFKHFKEVGFQLFSMVTKLLTGSSALATYFIIGIVQAGPLRYTYLGFTVLSCVNATASMLYNSILLRWVVMKEESKTEDNKTAKVLEFLKFKVPSTHISFALGLFINGGIIGLNSYILANGLYIL